MKTGINHSAVCYMYLRAFQPSREMLFKSNVKRLLSDRLMALGSMPCVHACVCVGMCVLCVDLCIYTHTFVSLCVESSKVITDLKQVIAFPFPCAPFILCHSVMEALIDCMGLWV